MRTLGCYQLCLAADHCAAETILAFTHSLTSSLLFLELNRTRSQGWRTWTGKRSVKESLRVKCGGRVQKARQSSGTVCDKHGASLCDWWLLHRSGMTHTFSTSALVTLMSASIFSKYCCALSASLQSRSNFLLDWQRQKVKFNMSLTKV